MSLIFICYQLFWFDLNLRRNFFIEPSSELGAPILDRGKKNRFRDFSIRSFKFLGRRLVSFWCIPVYPPTTKGLRNCFTCLSNSEWLLKQKELWSHINYPSMIRIVALWRICTMTVSFLLKLRFLGAGGGVRKFLKSSRIPRRTSVKNDIQMKIFGD